MELTGQLETKMKCMWQRHLELIAVSKSCLCESLNKNIVHDVYCIIV